MALLVAALAACASAPSAPPETARGPAPALLAPMEGRYEITQDGDPLGHERFTISSTAGRWRAEGEIVLGGFRQGYRLDLEPRGGQLIDFEVWVEAAGLRQWALGQVEGAVVHVEVDTIRGPEVADVPFAPGTVLDFPSPIANAAVLSRLGSALGARGRLDVRTISITLPMLAPAVILQSYALHGADGDLRKIAVGPPGVRRPTALWVRPDGLPVRVRTWPDERSSPIEMRLVTSIAGVSAAE